MIPSTSVKYCVLLEKMLERDHAKSSLTGVSELGLVEMTRKRTRESLGQMLCSPCPVCVGRGTLKSAETICFEIFREILREVRAYDTEEIVVLASQLVIDRLLDEESSNVADSRGVYRPHDQVQGRIDLPSRAV